MLQNKNIKVVLDTHVFLMLMLGQRDMRLEACDMVHQLVADGGHIAISTISLWEVCTLDANGSIQLHLPSHTWLERALQAPGLCVVEISPQIASESTSLPGSFQGDPADRIIAATARVLGVPLLTRDDLLLTWASQGHVQCMAA